MTDNHMIIENGVLVTYTGKETQVTIPAGVKAIGSAVFMRNYAVRTVIIPEGVTEIRDRAFMCCYKLESIVIPGSVTKIGACAFANCSRLESLTFCGCGLRELDEMAFIQCRLLKEIKLPESLEVIGKSVFYECTGLERINIPAALKKIGKKAFFSCKLLKLANEPECVPAIGEDAFLGTDPRIMKAFADAQRRLIPLYSACIVTVTDLRRHRYADHLQCAQIGSHSVIVDDTCRIGQRLVYFPVGGQLNEAFAKENHLLRHDEPGNRTCCYVHPVKRNITAARIHGEVSDGLALPIEVLAKYTDTDTLKDGDRIFTLNGHPICTVYIPDGMEISIPHKTLVRYRSRKGTAERVYIPWGITVIGEAA